VEWVRHRLIQDDLHVPITVLPALTAPPSLFLFFMPLDLRYRTTPNRHQPLPRGSRTLVLLSRFSFPFMRLHLSYSFPITGTPRGRRYDTQLRHSRIVHRSLIIKQFFLPFVSLSAYLSQPFLLSLSLSLSLSIHLSVHLLLLDDISILAAPSLDTTGRRSLPRTYPVLRITHSPFRVVVSSSPSSADRIYPTLQINSLCAFRACSVVVAPHSQIILHSSAPLQKLVYLICNILTLALGPRKCRSMGLLPTGTGDWLAFESRGSPAEMSLF
jgi:hypothetical protein